VVEKLNVEAMVKIRVMDIIDAHLRRNFRTLEDAAEYANVTWVRLSRLRSGHHDQFSLAWLFKLAEKTNVKMRIDIYPRK
jgi:hypothetical protein